MVDEHAAAELCDDESASARPRRHISSTLIARCLVPPGADHVQITRRARESAAVESHPVRSQVSNSLLQRCVGGLDANEELQERLDRYHRSLIEGDADPRYLVEQVIGYGGQGVVYQVYDTDCGRVLALKVMRNGKRSAAQIARFVHEAQITSQLEHPGIVPVHDFDALPGGTLFYTMKRVRGQTLKSVIARRHASQSGRYALLHIFVRICETIAFAHSRGVIHRDLKPVNVMIGRYGEVQIMDWGLSKVLGSAEVDVGLEAAQAECAGDDSSSQHLHVSEFGKALGTPAYMSPEQARGELDQLDGRSDIYSLGVILYEMLTGVSPYEDAVGDGGLCLWVASRGIPRTSLERIDTRPLTAIVERAMAFAVEDRYASVEDLANDVRAYLTGAAVSAHQEGPFERVARWSRFHRRYLQVGVGVASVAGILAGLMVLQQFLEQERTVANLRNEADQALANGELAQARAAFDRLVFIDPTDTRARRGLDLVEQRAAEYHVQQQAAEVAELRQAFNAQIVVFDAAIDDIPRQAVALQEAERFHAKLEAISESEFEARQLAALRDRFAQNQADVLLQQAAALQEQLETSRKAQAQLRESIARQRMALEREGRSELRRSLHQNEQAIEKETEYYASRHSALSALLNRALALDESYPPTLRSLADLYATTIWYAEERDDRAAALSAAKEGRRYDRERRYCLLFAEEGLIVAPPDQAIEVIPLVEGPQRTLVASEATTQLAPGTRKRFALGRYCVVYPDGARQSVRLGWGDSWEAPTVVRPANLPESVVYIPAGTIFLQNQSVEVPHGFAMMRREVSCGEYIEFLEAMFAQGADLAHWIPRQNETSHFWERIAPFRYVLTGSGREGVPVDSEWPVVGINAGNAFGYCAWLSRKDDRQWRLPTEYEWRLAAQGGDGRRFPWGERADVNLCFSGQVFNKREMHGMPMLPGGSMPLDRSLHGVFDLGGSVAELTSSRFPNRQRMLIYCGGSFVDFDAGRFTTQARRGIGLHGTRINLGFRLVFDVAGGQDL